jgi:formylglycine-generating enzyme required for sulfatase activity
MHGNVREWCHDTYTGSIDPYDVGDTDPLEEEFTNVTRGGDYNSMADETRCANRRGDPPLENPQYTVGFRIARTLRQP